MEEAWGASGIQLSPTAGGLANLGNKGCESGCGGGASGGGSRVQSANLAVRRPPFQAHSPAREPAAVKHGGFGMSVAPTDDLHRWPLFAEPVAVVPTTAALE
jgi:hypothetical protein